MLSADKSLWPQSRVCLPTLHEKQTGLVLSEAVAVAGLWKEAVPGFGWDIEILEVAGVHKHWEHVSTYSLGIPLP